MPYKPHDNESTFKRIFVAASNIERNAEDGCMKKIKIERSLKLRQEDTRGRSTDLITNTNSEENSWLNSFGGQKDKYYDQFKPYVEKIHTEKA